MPIYKYSINDDKYVTTESILCRRIISMPEKDAIKYVERSGCLAFVEQRDKESFAPTYPTAHSWRIKLSVRKGKVTHASIG